MAYGIVKWFDARRGFGFISRAGFVSRDGGGVDLFVHHSEINGDGARLLDQGELVTFTVEQDPKGLRAVGVSASRSVRR